MILVWEVSLLSSPDDTVAQSDKETFQVIVFFASVFVNEDISSLPDFQILLLF